MNFYKNISEKNKGVVSIIAMTFAFATMAVFARYLGDSGFALFEQVYLRLSVAFLIGSLLFVKYVDFKKFFSLPKKELYVLIFRAVTMYLGVVLFTEAALHTKLANASVVAFVPLLPFFAYYFLGEKLNLKIVFYVALSFLGVILLGFKSLSFSSFGYGEMMGFASMLLFDLSYIARRWQSDYLNNKEISLAMFFIAAVGLFVVSLVIGETKTNLFTIGFLPVCILLGSGLANAVTLVLTNYGFQKVPFTISGNLLAFESLFALMYGMLLFSEIPTGVEVLGAFIIIFSAVQINRIT